MNFRIVGAILRKDLRSLYPLALLAALLFAADVFILRWELVPLWGEFRPLLLILVEVLATLAVFQLDSPVSLVDDWLCRPVPRRELVAAKLAFLFTVIYLPGALATFVADLCLGASLVEASQDALLLHDEVLPYFALVLPLLLLTALVTRTLVQGLGVLIALFVCMFMIPTPFVHAPDPSSTAFGDWGLLGAGLGWLATAPAKLVPLLLAALGFWLVYARRRIGQTRVLLAITAAATAFLLLLPMWLLPWNRVMAAQTTLHAVATPANARDVYLHQTRTCFPAARLGELPRDPAFTAAREASGLRAWSSEDLRESGPESIAFLTTVEPRRVPPDWRVKLNYVQADYFARGVAVASLRPALYAPGLSHAWVLPASVLQRLDGATAALKLHYSVTLLAPQDFRLPTDGRRHALPGLGHCRAEVDATSNRIEVECFSAVRRPAQISAQLNDIVASRVSAPPDLSPAWAQWLSSQRVNLSIGSPRLADYDTITVTAWRVAGYLDRSVTLPGILGSDVTTCPLPTADGGSFQTSRWRDAAPHEPASIKVADGVQLEVLDFGGTGAPLLLLPGLGASAHSYDELAPLLARNHRVVAMTRRGAGYSSKPDFGYDTPRLAQDVLAVMDAMGLRNVVLVGHSIAGEELTWLGGHDPDRFTGLVYLDAAYDRSNPRANPLLERLRVLNTRVPPEPPIPPRALRNYDAMTQWLEATDRVRLPEGELIATWQVDKPFVGGTPNIEARTQQAIQAAIRPPDYEAVKVPALAIYAIDDAQTRASRHDADDLELIASLAEISRLRHDLQRRNIERFRRGVARGQVLEMRNARHYILQSNTREVADAIEKFAASLSAN